MKGLLSAGPTPSSFSSSYFLDKVVDLFCGGSGINRTYPVLFFAAIETKLGI